MLSDGVARGDAVRAAAAWLEWQAAMGVDCCLEAPATSAPRRGASEADEGAVARGSGTATPSRGPIPAPVASAREIARACRSLDELTRALEAFELCPLKETATRLCLSDGNPAAKIMLVGEAPGVEEDRQGKPFVGPSGKLLDRMLATIGLDRSKVYITNTVFWRPPGNRAPTALELATCLPFLERQIELLAPALLLFVGGIAAKALLGLKDGVTRLRGQRFAYRSAEDQRPIPARVIFHPAYLLRQPMQKRFAWRDLLQIAEELRQLGITADAGLPAREGGHAAEQPR